MEVTFESKYIVVLIFLQFIAVGRSAMIHHGKESSNLRSQKVTNAQDDVALHWPKGIVTYYLDNFVYDDLIARRLRMAMNVLESASCVRFKPALVKPGNMTWIHFTNPQAERKCVHEPKFKDSGEIVLVLGLDCLKEREILHTLLHAIGFKDEVSHPQRDMYIRVMWNNIQPEFRYLYRIQTSNEMPSTLLVEYDPLSIMHFHDRAFSVNGHATVMPLVPGLLISPSNDLSQLDKMRLRLLFDHECNKRKVGDIIETCKMISIDSVKPDSSKNVTNDTDNIYSEEKEEKQENVKDEKEEKEEKDDNEENEEEEEKGESDKEGYADEIDKPERYNQTQLKSIENNYDLNELDQAKLNKNKMLYQKREYSAESISVDDNEEEYDY